MVKQLIMAVTFLLIQNVSEAIYYICAIFNFTMLVYYLLHNNKTLFYINYALYRLDKKKIVFENYCSIKTKLF